MVPMQNSNPYTFHQGLAADTLSHRARSWVSTRMVTFQVALAELVSQYEA